VTRRATIRRAEVGGHLVDVEMEDARIAAVVPAGDATEIPGFDAGGGALLPGLHDHHLHLLALAAARHSVRCGPPAVEDPAGLTAALRDADQSTPGGRWLRGVGYHESVAGPLDRHALDAIVGARPCRVQHRSGHAWTLNTAALAAAGVPSAAPDGAERDAGGRLTGRLFGLDGWLRDRVPHPPLDLPGVGAALASYGVTGVTDATPTTEPDDLATLAASTARGELPQHVVVTGAPELAVAVVPELERGPAKIVLADHRLPPLDDLVGAFRVGRAAGRCIAIHCVTRAALVLALAGWAEVGAWPGDRIEHGAVIPLELATVVAELGLTVVTQPGFVAERGDDYLRDVDADDRDDLWRCATLRIAGVPVAGSTDAPFGDADPWRAIAAAVERRTRRGAVLGADERLPASDALDLFLSPLRQPGGPPRRVEAGRPADLCLLDRPLEAALREPSSAAVRLVLRAGRVIHGG
jgi:predicted amidohydrolase YtcJ